MSDLHEPSHEDSKVPAPIVDLLKRHATLPSRPLILSEAFEMARRLTYSGARGPSQKPSTTAEP